MNGAVQPGGRRTHWKTLQDRYGKGRGPLISRRMEVVTVGKVIGHQLLQLLALIVTTRKLNMGPPLLTAAAIVVAVDQVRDKPERHQGLIEYPTVCGTSYIGLIQGCLMQSSTQP